MRFGAKFNVSISLNIENMKENFFHSKNSTDIDAKIGKKHSDDLLIDEWLRKKGGQIRKMKMKINSKNDAKFFQLIGKTKIREEENNFFLNGVVRTTHKTKEYSKVTNENI